MSLFARPLLGEAFMATFSRRLALAAISVPCGLLLTAATGAAQDDSYHMPEYADEGAPPPRPRADVDKLLAGADNDISKADDEAAPPLKVVLIAGPKDHGKGEHDYPNWQKVWSRLLAKAPRTTIDTAWEFPILPPIYENTFILPVICNNTRGRISWICWLGPGRCHS